MFQLIIVILIGLVCVGYLGWKIYRFFTRPETANPCTGCSGCALKGKTEFSKQKNGIK